MLFYIQCFLAILFGIWAAVDFHEGDYSWTGVKGSLVAMVVNILCLALPH